MEDMTIHINEMHYQMVLVYLFVYREIRPKNSMTTSNQKERCLFLL